MKTSPTLSPHAWALIASILVVFAALPARAHPARTSAVLLDIGEASVEAELQLPLDQLGLALGKPVDASPGSLVAEMGPELSAYLAAHFGATTGDERPFSVDVRSLEVTPIDGADSLVAHVSLRPPDGATTAVLTLHDNVVLHRVVTHKIFVSIRRDFKNAVFSDHPELAGVLRFQRDSLVIDRSRGSWWRGVGSVFMLGTRHIAEGTDHLLFLLVLLLPSPLLAKNGRWSSAGGAARSVREVLKIVTAFTLGHSITLLAAATRVVKVPSQPVEILIAASILVSAAHAARPVLAGREPWIAGGFGLIHGLAFATALADLGFDARTLAVSVLGFNLGIEAMQLLVVLLVMPLLVLLSRTGSYKAVRLTGALVGAVAACVWIAERAFGPHGPA